MTRQTGENSTDRKIISRHSVLSEKNIFRFLEVESISFVYRECHFNVRIICLKLRIMLCDMKKQFRSIFGRSTVRVMHGVLLIVTGCVVGWAQSFVTVDKN